MFAAAGGAASQPAAVRVAAASDLQFALEAAIREFSVTHPSVRVEPAYGSSGNFHAQLRQRAPFDLFLSADMRYVEDLVSRGIGRESDTFAYATGRLVIWVPNGSPLRVEQEGLAALAGASRIAIANPRHAPYGRAAEAALRRAGLWERLQPRIVRGDSVAQAAQFVQSGAADAGLIAGSLATAEALRNAGRFVEVPRDAYPELVQGGLVLPWARSREAAVAFRNFLTGPGGRAVLAANGFAIPG